MNCLKCDTKIENHGPEEHLDALFAEKVMDYKTGYQRSTWWDDNADEHPVWCVEKDGKLEKICSKSHFNPSTNISHAMEGVEKHRKEIFVEIRILPGIVYVGIFPNNPGEFPFIYSKAENLELAITRALILWAWEKGK